MTTFKRTAVFLLVFIAAINQAFPSGYNINVRISGLEDTTLLLAYHFGNRKYIKDTIMLDSRGEGMFKDDEALPGGIYLVVMPDMDYFEILVDREQEFRIETTVDNPVENIRISGSAENEQFFEYHRFMNRRQRASSDLQQRIEMNRDNPDSVKILQERGRELDREVQEYWNSIIERQPGTLLANLIRAMKNPQIPEFELPEGTHNPDSVRWRMGYDYNRKHFFDNIDFSDDRLLRTPVLHNRLEHFFTRTLMQVPDMIIPEAVRVIELAKANDDVFQYVLVYLLNHYERSNIMGMDEVFVELAERYYLSGEAFWVNDETIRRLRDRVERMKPNLIGRTAAEMRMRIPDGSFVNLHGIEAEYTIIYFYEPACGHCKVVTPRLNELYKKYRDQGLQVFAVYIYDDVEEWQEYINDNGLDWVNVFDPQNETNFRFNYDIYSTPTLYVLDADKTIIAKRIGIETIEQMVEDLL
ncbi:MAG: DUF5106 domain-containing protein [Marinilabiliales bacterium]|nr:MAG: DUF5106 domain-containing protein [Marinilabiliales bacterium]